MKVKMIANILASHFGSTWYLENTEKTNFSLIYFFTDGKRKMVVKSIAPASFIDLAEKDKTIMSDQMNRNTNRFRELLSEFKVPLSKEFMALVSQDTFEPLHILSYEGPDCLKLITADPSKQNVRRVLRGILTSVEGVLHQSEPLRVGTDLQLANFTLNGKFRYVDIFPPLIWDEANKQYIVHVPQPKTKVEINEHIIRKFTMVGTLRRLRFFVLSLSTEYESILMQEINNVLDSEHWFQLKNYFNGLPDIQFKKAVNFSTEKLLKVFDEMPETEYDQMRDIAVRIIPNDRKRAETLSQVFRMTRNLGPGDIREGDGPKEEVKKLLLKYVN